MSMNFSVGPNNLLSVSRDGSQPVLVSFDDLVRQKRALTALRAREIARLDQELADTDEMLKACQALGTTGRGSARGIVAAVDQHPVFVPRPSVARRVWATLTRPRGIGQRR